MKFGLTIAHDSLRWTQKMRPPLGLGYIVSFAEKYLGFKNFYYSSNINKVLSEKPDLVGISADTQNFNTAIELASGIKAKLDIPIVVGGVHISMLPRMLPTCFDIGVIGEGEVTTGELIKTFQSKGRFNIEDLKKIKGIVFRDKKGKLTLTPNRELIRNLDDIPFPNREIFEEEWTAVFKKEIHMVTSRGCPYRCKFCISSRYWRNVRSFSIKYIANEIEYFYRRYKMQEIIFMDDIFYISKKNVNNYIKEFNKLLCGKNISFHCGIRSSDCDENILIELKKMNVKSINFGAESGNDRILKYLKGNNANVNKNQQIIDLCHKHNIHICLSFVIGSPIETEEDLNDTRMFIERNKNKIDMADIYPLIPFPGTPMWNYALREGLVSENMDWSRFNIDPETFNKANYIYLNKKINKERFFYYFNEFLKQHYYFLSRNNA